VGKEHTEVDSERIEMQPHSIHGNQPHWERTAQQCL